MSSPLVAIGWGVVGALAGWAIRVGSVYLARREELEPGARRWQVLGPVVLAGLLFAAFGWRLGFGPQLLIRSLWVALLVQVIFFDFEHHLILDRVLLPGYAAALLLAPLTPHLGWKQALVAGVAVGLGFLLLALVGSAIFRAEALGFGDVKLGLLMGMILGQSVFYAVLLGVILAGVVSIVLLLTRLRSMRDAIAYGPYLAAGTLVELYQVSGH